MVLQAVFDAIENNIAGFRVRQRRYSKMIGIRSIEATARRNENVMTFQEFQRKRLIVQFAGESAIEAQERIHRAHRSFQV